MLSFIYLFQCKKGACWKKCQKVSFFFQNSGRGDCQSATSRLQLRIAEQAQIGDLLYSLVHGGGMAEKVEMTGMVHIGT
jgi:hypothetical protein